MFKYATEEKQLTKKQKEELNKTLKCGIESLQVVTRIYTKCEWERCKDTSIHGDSSKYNTNKAFDTMFKKYEKETLEEMENLSKNTYESIIGKKLK